MRLTATKLREDIYNVLDQVAKTGQAVEVERNGVILQIVSTAPPSKLDRLATVKERVWVGDPGDIFRMDYMEEWRSEWLKD